MARSLWLWVILLIAWLIGGTWYYSQRFCCGDDQLPETNTALETLTDPPVSGSSFPSLRITDGKQSFFADSTFFFPQSGAMPNIPRGAAGALKEFSTYLQSGEVPQVVLTGVYTLDEENATDFTNLGLARAANIRAYLMGLGVDSSMLITDAELRGDLPFVKGILPEGVEMMIRNEPIDLSPPSAEVLAEQAANLEGEPLNVYFESGSSRIIDLPRLQRYVKKLQSYLRHVPEAKASVIGFTDNTGSLTVNQQISEDRARSVREVLVTMGVGHDKMVVSGRGPENFIDTNDTPEGRANNRRVEIRLMK
ncbi:MAG: OmpA family protein [Bacteroidota bacterium]